MAEKRKHEGGERSQVADGHVKKVRKGFSVGPANLPEGMHKRKTQAIKDHLIQRALIKRQYATLKRQGKIPEQEALPVPASAHLDAPDKPEFTEFTGFPEDETADPVAEPTTAPHPDRQILLDKEAADPEEHTRSEPARPRDRPPKVRKPKHKPFQREHDRANELKEEAEERRRAREEAERQRQEKIEEREKFRRAMAKARTGGRNGQRKLGRESGVLLDRVKRMVSDGRI